MRIVSPLICFLTCLSTLGASPRYETYLESWDPSWKEAMEGLPPTADASQTSVASTMETRIQNELERLVEYQLSQATGETSPNDMRDLKRLSHFSRGSADYANTVVNVGFAAYVFPDVNGIQFSRDDLQDVVHYVQSQGGKVRLSFGGASYASPWYPYYFISRTEGWPSNADSLASDLVALVEDYKLDGLDFDIEDPQPAETTPDEFASQLMDFLKAVRARLPSNKEISVTLAGQSWRAYGEFLAQYLASEPDLVNQISFMEYDIWVNPDLKNGYPEQILADLVTYTSSADTSPPPNNVPGWGVPAHLITLGLMPGLDDLRPPNILSVADAASLAEEAVKMGLAGVMTWSLNRDAHTDLRPPIPDAPPYAYSVAIREILTP